MFSLLTPEDIEKIRSYISYYSASNSAPLCAEIGDMRHILRIWAHEKSTYLKDAFKDGLILEREVEYCTNANQIRIDISRALESGDLREFYRAFYAAIEQEFGWYTDPFCWCRSLMNPKPLATNIAEDLPVRDVTVTFSSGKKVKLSHTAKTVKLLGKISKELGLEEEFERFRLAHSLYLNQKRIKGTLCLSIHPLDYITMSDNANGWSSCMSWKEDGDYRGGTVEMMNSPYVIVAYLKSHDKTLKWDSFEWNSKLWRSLIVVAPSVITTIKGYPYQNEDLAKTCVEWVRELVGPENYESECITIPAYSNFDYAGKTRYFEFSTTRMYNDFDTVPHYGYVGKEFEGRINLCYSGPAECVICGDTGEYIFPESHFVVCEGCCDADSYRYIECSECWNDIHPDDVYWVEDQPLCPCCFESYANPCDLSGEYYFEEHLTNVYLARTDDCPSEDDMHLHVGRGCLGSYSYRPGSWMYGHCTCAPQLAENGLSYWNVSDWTERGLDAFWNLSSSDEVLKYIQEKTEK